VIGAVQQQDIEVLATQRRLVRRDTRIHSRQRRAEIVTGANDVRCEDLARQTD